MRRNRVDSLARPGGSWTGLISRACLGVAVCAVATGLLGQSVQPVAAAQKCRGETCTAAPTPALPPRTSPPADAATAAPVAPGVAVPAAASSAPSAAGTTTPPTPYSDPVVAQPAGQPLAGAQSGSYAPRPIGSGTSLGGFAILAMVLLGLTAAGSFLLYLRLR